MLMLPFFQLFNGSIHYLLERLEGNVQALQTRFDHFFSRVSMMKLLQYLSELYMSLAAAGWLFFLFFLMQQDPFVCLLLRDAV